MQTETAIFEDIISDDDKQNFRRLIRAVKFSKKHYLYFVCCNQVPKQNELIAETKKNLKERKIEVVKFKKPINDLLTELQKLEIEENCEAVFIQGLEYSISSDGRGNDNALIYNLNISRDSFKKYLTCPLFLWLPEYALVKIIRHAPDFFSVRSGTFYFSNPPEKVTRQILQSISSDWHKIMSLPIAEKHKQIKILENLLAEYRGLPNEKQDKTAEITLLGKLGVLFHSISEFNKAIEYHKQALETSRKIENPLAESYSLGNLGLAYRYLSNFEKAIEFYKQALEISRKIGDQQSECSSLGNLGTAYHNLGNFSKAIEYYEKVLEISRETGNRPAESSAIGNLGHFHFDFGNLPEAIKYYTQHLDITREIGDREGEGNSLNGLGNVYNSLGEKQKAVEYYKQALEISREIGDRHGENFYLVNLGNTYNDSGDFKKAIEYYENALKISREIGNRLVEGEVLQNSGNARLKLGEKETACRLFKEALIIFESIELRKAIDIRRLIEENC